MSLPPVASCCVLTCLTLQTLEPGTSTAQETSPFSALPRCPLQKSVTLYRPLWVCNAENRFTLTKSQAAQGRRDF